MAVIKFQASETVSPSSYIGANSVGFQLDFDDPTTIKRILIQGYVLFNNIFKPIQQVDYVYLNCNETHDVNSNSGVNVLSYAGSTIVNLNISDSQIDFGTWSKINLPPSTKYQGRVHYPFSDLIDTPYVLGNNVEIIINVSVEYES